MTIYNTYPSAAAIAVAKAFVAALADVIKVPLSFGNVIVLSAVGSVTVKVVSCASAVAPSNTILASVKFNWVACKFVIVGLFIVGLVKVLFVKVCVPVFVTTVLSILTVIVCPDAEVSIPVPPVIVNDWLSKSTAPVPLSPIKSKSVAPTVVSTYA